MKNLFKLSLAVLASGIATHGTSAKAQIITEYTSETLFNSAVAVTDTVTFEGAVDSGSRYTPYSGTNDFGSDVNFTDATGDYAVSTGFGSSYNDLTTSLVGDGNSSQILAPIATTGVTALGTQIFSGNTTALTDTVEVFLVGNTSSTPNGTYTVSADAVDNSAPTSFVGFTTTSGSIARVVFETSPFPLDNVEIGSLKPAGIAVPEPSTFACILLGGAVFLVYHRRKRSNV